MANYYNNIPQQNISDSAAATLKVFDQFGQPTITLEAGAVDACTGFFESRGFDRSSSETIAYIILKQAKIDGYSPFQILDTLNGLDKIQISALVTEILNYNRFKTSSLGMAQTFIPVQEIQRNIAP
jgi:hypothetical protein